MTVLISEHAGLYQEKELEAETKIPSDHEQSTTQRGKVEWLPKEDAQTPPPTVSSTRKEKQSTPPADSEPTGPSIITSEKGEVCQMEVTSENTPEVDKVEESKADGKGGSEVAVSPSKQSKPQPSWRSSFKGSAASAVPRGKIGGSAGDVSSAGGSNWLMNGLSSLRVHRRTTSSGERLKDSTMSLKDSTLSLRETVLSLKDPQRSSNVDPHQASLSQRAPHQTHRLSAYDNVAPSSLSLPADTSSIWTSFEISLAEPEGSDKALKLGQGQERPTEVRDNTSTLDQSESGIEDDPAGTNESLTVMLAELKQELKKQRTSYETCIRK